MIKHLGSKIMLTLYFLIALALGFWGYSVFKQRDGKVAFTNTQQVTNQSDTFDSNNNPNSSDLNGNSESPSDSNCENSSTCSIDPNSPDSIPKDSDQKSDSTSKSSDANAPKVSTTPNISGSILAHITPEHCTNSCQAFANDLKLFEYCEEACGISPIKNVSDCSSKKDIRKDYCLKDLAIGKEDISKCNDISDGNIKQACKNRIAQDSVEKQVEDLQNTAQPPSN